MSVMRIILMRMFRRPRGVLGRLGGIIMASTNEGCGAWVAELLEVGPCDSVLEVGFGPGVVIHGPSKLASAGRVAGIDPSHEMLEQARARNAAAIRLVVSTCDTAPWRTCRSTTTFLIVLWRLTQCKSGRTLLPD